MLDELGDAAGVLELGTLGLAGLGIGGALVDQRDLQALVEEGELAQPLGQGVEVVFGDGEDRAVGQKVNLGPALLGVPVWRSLETGMPLAVLLLVGVPVFPDLDVELFAERVHAGNTDAVQSARDLVGGRVELAAGVQLGEHHLRRQASARRRGRPSRPQECRGRRR